jgi:hypothetical protein
MSQLYIFPITLTAGIFSVNKDVIPFIPASFRSFVALVFTFGILGIVLHVFQLYQTWFWQVVMAFAGQKRWDVKISYQSSSSTLPVAGAHPCPERPPPLALKVTVGP